MPIPVECRCGKITNVPTTMAGKRITCVSCSAPLVIPPAPGPSATASAPPDQELETTLTYLLGDTPEIPADSESTIGSANRLPSRAREPVRPTTKPHRVWGVRRKGKQLGTFSAATIRAMLSNGDLRVTDSVRAEGSEGWVRIAKVSNLWTETTDESHDFAANESHVQAASQTQSRRQPLLQKVYHSPWRNLIAMVLVAGIAVISLTVWVVVDSINSRHKQANETVMTLVADARRSRDANDLDKALNTLREAIAVPYATDLQQVHQEMGEVVLLAAIESYAIGDVARGLALLRELDNDPTTAQNPDLALLRQEAQRATSDDLALEYLLHADDDEYRQIINGGEPRPMNWTVPGLAGVFAETLRRQSGIAKTKRGAAIAASKQAEAAREQAAAEEEKRAAEKRMRELAKLKKAKVRITVTWEYNKFKGHVADEGAVVVLVPKGLGRKLPSAGLSPTFARINIDATQRKLADQNAFVGVAGGDGKAVLNRVIPGAYTLIIISKSTTSSPTLAKLKVELLSRYFDGDPAGGQNVEIKEIEVLEDEDLELNHDFGNTYF